MEIVRLRQTYGQEIADVGYSGYHIGSSIDIAAFALGASIIERHFTLNKNARGTDHAASLDAIEMTSLREALEVTSQAIAYKVGQILPVEESNRKKLKWVGPARDTGRQ